MNKIYKSFLYVGLTLNIANVLQASYLRKPTQNISNLAMSQRNLSVFKDSLWNKASQIAQEKSSVNPKKFIIAENGGESRLELNAHSSKWMQERLQVLLKKQPGESLILSESVKQGDQNFGEIVLALDNKNRVVRQNVLAMSAKDDNLFLENQNIQMKYPAAKTWADKLFNW